MSASPPDRHAPPLLVAIDGHVCPVHNNTLRRSRGPTREHHADLLALQIQSPPGARMTGWRRTDSVLRMRRSRENERGVGLTAAGTSGYKARALSTMRHC